MGACLVLFFTTFACRAEELAHPSSQLDAMEMWTGLEGFRTSTSLYTGATWAPSGDLSSDGVRLRFVLGQSGYRYQAPSGPAHAASPFAEALLGTQFTFSQTTIKAFAGAFGYARVLDPADSLDLLAHVRVGPKLGVETWTNFGDRAFATLDATWTSLDSGYWSRIRGGYRLTPELSVGLEGGASGNTGTAAIRGGAFLRFAWPHGEVGVSGGLAGDGAGAFNVPKQGGQDRHPAPYGTALLLFKF